MDLFPHDKLTKYLANRPNFPPSPQVLSLKEESSEVKRLLKLGRAGGGFARCSEGGKEISRTISNRVPYAISRRLGHLLPDFFANCTPVGHSPQPLRLQSTLHTKCVVTLFIQQRPVSARDFSGRLLVNFVFAIDRISPAIRRTRWVSTRVTFGSVVWEPSPRLDRRVRDIARTEHRAYPRRIRDSRPAPPVRENNTFSVSRTSPRKVGTHPSP